MIIKLFCLLLFKLKGWKYVNKVPMQKGEGFGPCVMVGAPHTSNWDFVPVMSVILLSGMGRRAKFVIKAEWLFSSRLLLRSIGAVGVVEIRSQKIKKKASNYLLQILWRIFLNNILKWFLWSLLKVHESRWRNGSRDFYHCKKAGVPLLLAYADYAKKEIVTGDKFMPTDFEADMKESRATGLLLVTIQKTLS